MKLKGYERIGEQLYSERLHNGLQVFIVPKRGYNKRYAFFAADYGGADRRFFHDGRLTDTPEGVAHFLEHKMFDTEDGNALMELSANGASPNAFTSSAMTAYHFECIEKFEENLEILLNFVSVPYFTDESVAKERGIIGQEIRMVEDEPDYSAFYGLMKALYDHHPIRDSVAGTVESIAEISAQTLYACHSVFYNPSNMVLCVAGDVDPERVLAIARAVLPREAGERPRRDYGVAEALLPVTRKTEKRMEISRPIFVFGCKSKSEPDGERFLRRDLTAALAIEYLAGKSSPLFIRLYNERLINNDFSAAFESSLGAAHFIAGGESNDPQAVFDAFADYAGRIAETGLDKKLFSHVKKAAFGRQIRLFNSFDRICNECASGYFRGYDAFAAPQALDSLTEDETLAFIKENFSPERMAISIIRPQNT